VRRELGILVGFGGEMGLGDGGADGNLCIKINSIKII